MKYFKMIQHRHWTTEIEYLGAKGNYKYRVTTTSGFYSIQPQDFCHTLEQARRIVAEHIEQVKEF